jgi:hypothetical protein
VAAPLEFRDRFPGSAAWRHASPDGRISFGFPVLGDLAGEHLTSTFRDAEERGDVGLIRRAALQPVEIDACDAFSPVQPVACRGGLGREGAVHRAQAIRQRPDVALDAIHRFVRDCKGIGCVRIFSNSWTESHQLGPDFTMCAGQIALVQREAAAGMFAKLVDPRVGAGRQFGREDCAAPGAPG